MKVSVFWCHICPPWQTSVSTIHQEKLWKRYRISRGNYSVNCKNSYSQLRPHMCRIEDLLNVKDWGFMHTSVLRQAFPVDQETNNFVRQVHNQVFLCYILFRLDKYSPLRQSQARFLQKYSIWRQLPVTWRNRQLFKNSCGNLILPNSPLLSHR